MLTAQQIETYHRDGYVLVENRLSKDEIALLLRAVESGQKIDRHALNLPDASGRSSKLAIWSDLGNDVFAAVSASPRLVIPASMLVGEELYHWHSKVMLKEARTGGSWEWHQDYGYWYNDGCLYPNMISCMIALDDATRANGCLKVIPGSHKLGRINHGGAGRQTGADPQRIEAILARLPVTYCEAPSGSALFFHCNTLHASEANNSDGPRRAYICCYNALSNAPHQSAAHGAPVRLPLAPDNAILDWKPAS